MQNEPLPIMDRSGRLFSSSFSTSVANTQETHATALPGKGSQLYWNFASDDVSQNLQKAARADPDFADVICAAWVYKIERRAINNIGVGELDARRQAFSIGEGLTSEVVQHALIDEESSADPPPTTTIALKIFRSSKQNSQTKTRSARQKVYDSILREMKALAHPSLSNHPHILKLLFIGWSKSHTYPLLAMELGEHGSLDHILRTRGPGPTTRQKRNLTIDIALGLQAIHKAGFIHGDLKPDNIIVFSSDDPARQISAKLSDFGGSSEIYDEHDGAPTHFTPLWSAPEALAKRSKIHWDLADVYSYGLVVASLWANPKGSEEDSEGKDHGADYPGSSSNTELPRSSVLFGFVPFPSGEGQSSDTDSSDEDFSSDEDLPSDEDLLSEHETLSDGESTPEEDNEGLKYMKCLPESHPDSLMSVLRTRITKRSLSAEINPIEIFAILTPALKPNWWDRPEMDDFMVVISKFSKPIGRVIEPLLEQVDSETYVPQPIRTYTLQIDILSSLMYSDSRDIMFSYVFRALDEINNRMKYKPQPEDIPDHIPEDFSTDQFLGILLANIDMSLGNLFNAMQDESRDDIWSGVLDFIKKGVFLCDLGLSGTSIPQPGMALGLDKPAFNYLQESALHGHPSAIPSVTFALSAGNIIHESAVPIRLNLTLLALSHSSLALRRLHSTWPGLYAIVRKVMRERGLICLEETRKLSPGLHDSQQLVKAYLEAAPLEYTGLAPLRLGDALEIGATERIKEILEDADQLLPADGEQPIHTLFYKLGKVPDAGAAALARTAYKRGARLDFMSTIHDDDILGSFPLQPSSTPLCAALERGQPMLAFEIFCLHVEFDVPIMQFRFAMELSFGNFYTGLGVALLRLLRDNPAMCHDLGNGDLDWPMANGDSMKLELSGLMTAPSAPTLKWVALMLHGTQHETAYTQTLRRLLEEEGADPAYGCSNHTPLGQSIISDDIVALKIFLDHMEIVARQEGEKSPNDVLLAFLNDPCNLASFQEKYIGSQLDWEYTFTALALCIRHSSLNCFEFLLTKVPSLINIERDAFGRTLLHRACSGVERALPNLQLLPTAGLVLKMEILSRAGHAYGPGLEFVDLLLKSGADVLAMDCARNTPLYWALRRVNIAAADMIASHSSPDQLKHLLRRDPSTGESIFAKLIETDIDHPLTNSRREPRLVTSLQWLQERGGIHFYGPGGTAVWRTILRRTPTLRTHQLMDANLMEYLIGLPVFAEKLHTERYDGFSALHLAAMHSNVDIVRLMLARQCDPNVAYEHELADAWGTPLDLIGFSLLAGNQMPGMDSASHPAFLKRHDAMIDIANMLLTEGGRSIAFEVLQRMATGSNGLDKEWEELLQIYRDTQQRVPSLKQDDIMGLWPMSLPSEDHSVVIASDATIAKMDSYLTFQTVRRAFRRLLERRHGELESSTQRVLLEQLYADATRNQHPPTSNGDVSALPGLSISVDSDRI